MSRLLACALAALVLAPLGCARQSPESAPPTPPEVVGVVRLTAPPTAPPSPLSQAPMPHPARKRLEVAPLPHTPSEPDLTNEDIGLDPAVPGGVEVPLPGVPDLTNEASGLAPGKEPPLPDLTVPGLIEPPAVATPGLPPSLVIPAVVPDEKLPPQDPFPWRKGETKKKLLLEGGGNDQSEQAVALGLAWLATKQMKYGGWEYDAGQKHNRIAATGMALLPFLGAGETHKSVKGKYAGVVMKGLDFLKSVCPLGGAKAGRLSENMYEQAIGTLALCEAYGMTKDPDLRPYAQAAVNFVQRAQGRNGSWGYSANTDGDTSIVGWQIQALHAARLCKDIVVDDRGIRKAVQFLNTAAAGPRKSMYGYADSKGAQPGSALTAVGLLCRYYIDGWGPNHPGMIDGVTGLLKNPPVGKGGMKNMYYHYYATQVVHLYEGEEWKNWNEGPKGEDGKRKGGMRDWLVDQQVKRDNDPNRGSWDPEEGFFGSSCGRLGTTCMCLLTLEVYYRYPPFKVEPKAIKLPEGK